jgi:hypothetical protein
MFYVYKFNAVAEEFEPLGAFSKREEADAFAETRGGQSENVVVAEQDWEMFVAQAVQVRLGKLADALKLLIPAALNPKA